MFVTFVVTIEYLSLFGKKIIRQSGFNICERKLGFWRRQACFWCLRVSSSRDLKTENGQRIFIHTTVTNLNRGLQIYPVDAVKISKTLRESFVVNGKLNFCKQICCKGLVMYNVVVHIWSLTGVPLDEI